MKLGSQNWERWSCPYRFWQGRGKYWTWRPNYDFTLSKSEHEREVHATHMVWKWSELKWVSHTLTLEVMVCRKCSIMSSSILSRNAFTLTFWPVLTLQMYVSLCQTVLLKNKYGKYWSDQIMLFSDQNSFYCNQHSCLGNWTCSGPKPAQWPAFVHSLRHCQKDTKAQCTQMPLVPITSEITSVKNFSIFKNK